MRFWSRLISNSSSHSDKVTTRPDSPARRAARSMQVGLVIAGRVVLDHHVDIVDVDAASGDVGGHERVKLAVTEVLQ